MTKARRNWLIGWAVVTVLIGIFTGGFGVLFPLVILGFIELIRLFILSIKQGKEKMARQKEKQKIIQEQVKVATEANSVIETNSQNDRTTIEHTTKMAVNETASKKIFITIFVVIITPFRLFLDPLFLGIGNMDTATAISKVFGFKTIKCRYCQHYFSSINWACKDSPNRRHRE